MVAGYLRLRGIMSLAEQSQKPIRRILAFDLGGVTGWCKHDPADPAGAPLVGHVKLAEVIDMDEGPMQRHLLRILIDHVYGREAILEIRPDGVARARSIFDGSIMAPTIDEIAVEAPVPMSPTRRADGSSAHPATTFNAIYLQIARASWIVGQAAVMGVRSWSTHAGSVRAHFCTLKKTHAETTKEWVMRNCNAISWYPTNDHEADAMASWDYMNHMLRQPNRTVGGQTVVGTLFKQRY